MFLFRDNAKLSNYTHKDFVVQFNQSHHQINRHKHDDPPPQLLIYIYIRKPTGIENDNINTYLTH